MQRALRYPKTLVGDHLGSAHEYRRASRVSSTSTSRSSSLASRATSPTPNGQATNYRFKSDIKDLECYNIAYNISSLKRNEEPDVLYPAPWKLAFSKLSGVLFVFGSVIGLWMCFLQLQFLAGEEGKALSPWRKRLNWFLLLSSFHIPLFNLQGILTFMTCFGRWRPRLRLRGDVVPSIDVVVTVCNERLDIVQDTVRAALDVDYPKDRFRVIITDDGASGKLQAWAAGLAREHPNIHYTARVKSGAGGYKAGNINHAVQFVQTIRGGAAELIAVLDADMIPSPTWLRIITPHLMQDAKMGVVCPAQQFYNTPNQDPLYQEWNHHWQFGHGLRDSIGLGANYGSGWVARRAAIDSIGGIPTSCLTEDVYSAYLMLADGWRTGYVTETVQWGLVPDSYHGHIKQMVRWYIGVCQANRQMGFFLRQKVTGKMSRLMRAMGALDSVQAHLEMPYLGLLSLFIWPAAIAYGVPIVLFNNDDWRLALRLSAASEINEFLVICLRSLFTGYAPSVRQGSVLSACLIPYYSIAHFRTFILPQRWGGHQQGFTPSGTIKSDVHERDRVRRASAIQRLRHVLFELNAWVHGLLLLTYIAALLMRLKQEVSKGADARQTLWHILRGVAWPGMPWLQSIIGLWLPIAYAFWPPTVPDRQDLMAKHVRSNGPRYPMERARKGGSRQRGSFWVEIRLFHWYSVYVVYCVTLLVGSFWW